MPTMFQCLTGVSYVSLAVGEIMGKMALKPQVTFSATVSMKGGGKKLVMLEEVSSSISERASQ